MADERYPDRLKRIYENVSKCRLVLDHNTEGDAIPFFQKQCNAAQPRDQYEEDVSIAVHELLRGTRLDFQRCLDTTPWYVLITDTRMILDWFKLEGVINMKWVEDRSAYDVSVPAFERRHKSNTYDDGHSHPVRGRGGGVTRGRGRGRGRGRDYSHGRQYDDSRSPEPNRNYNKVQGKDVNVTELLKKLEMYEKKGKKEPADKSIESADSFDDAEEAPPPEPAATEKKKPASAKSKPAKFDKKKKTPVAPKTDPKDVIKKLESSGSWFDDTVKEEAEAKAAAATETESKGEPDEKK
jgi:hypothetical protein